MGIDKDLPRIALLISGYGSNMEVIVKKAREGTLRVNPVVVFSDKAEAKGIGTAKELGVDTLTFSPKDFKCFDDYESELVNKLREYNVDLIVCAGYMRLLKKNILGSFKNKIVNIHPALLPAFPGLNAQAQAFDYGVKITGCTVHFVDEGVDTGAVIMQKEVFVEDTDTLETLTKKIQNAEHDTYWRAIDLVVSGFRTDGRRIIKKL